MLSAQQGINEYRCRYPRGILDGPCNRWILRGSPLQAWVGVCVQNPKSAGMQRKYCWYRSHLHHQQQKNLGFLNRRRNVALTQCVFLCDNKWKRRRTSEGVHCRLGSCSRCLFDRLIDVCLDQGLNLTLLALGQHSFIRRVWFSRSWTCCCCTC